MNREGIQKHLGDILVAGGGGKCSACGYNSPIVTSNNLETISSPQSLMWRQEHGGGSHVGEMCAAAVLTEWVSHVNNKSFHHQIPEPEDWLPGCILKECPLEIFAIQCTVI